MIGALVISCAIAYFGALPFASILQGNGYRIREFAKKIGKYSLISLIVFIVLLLAVVFTEIYCHTRWKYLAFLFFCIVTCSYLALITNRLKMPLKPTKRFNRLMLTEILIYSIVFLPLYFFDLTSIWSISPILCIFTLIFACAIINPFERKNNEKYIKKTKDIILNQFNARVGITGSYGKTTVKNYLYELLKDNIRTFVTPENYNTPLGICKAIDKLEGDESLFIAEMGARRRGDICELVEMCAPYIAIITGIAPQHLETFGDINAIMQEKNVLAESISADMPVFYNCTDTLVRELYEKREGKKVSVGFENDCNIVIKNIEISYSGSSFTLCVNNKDYDFHIKSIGKNFVVDFALATAVAIYYEVPIEQIREKGMILQSSPHRFQLIQSGNVHVIDDSYNVNIIGAKSALANISQLSASKKIIYTSGIVELGEQSECINKVLGNAIAEVADIVLIAKGKYGDAVERGIIDKNALIEIIRVQDTNEAQEIFKRILFGGELLLIMGDLPRDYLI